MSPVRLLELRSTYKWGGGPDKTILLSAERHDRRRVLPIVAYIRDSRDDEFRIGDRARALGLTYYEILESGKVDPRVIRQIRDIVVRHGITVVHAHDYKSDLIAYLVRAWLGRRGPALVSTAHAWVMLGARGALYRRLDLLVMRRFDQLIAVSHATKAEMVRAGLRAENIAVIHNGVDTDAWSPGRRVDDLRSALGLEGASPVIGYVGRITPEKDLATWLLAAARVVKGCEKARFVLVGDGRDGATEHALRRLVVRLGIEDRVVFAGYREDLVPVYATFDVFLLSSRREGLPNSILEAMAMGVPVVSTDVAGTRELVVDGETGFIRPQGDSEGLAKAVATLAQDGELRERMGRAGRGRVTREFSFGRRLERIEMLYERLVGGRAA